MRYKTLIVAILTVCSTVCVAQQALDNDTVIKMHTVGLGDDIIISTINGQPGTYDTRADGLIALKNAGISDKVIAAIIAKSTSQPVISPASVKAASVAAAPAVEGQFATEFPRIFISSVSSGNTWSASRDQSMEVSGDIETDCPSLRISISQQMADYTILLNHIEVGLAGRDNQMQVADKSGDLISKTKEGGSIDSGAKGACYLIFTDWFNKVADHVNADTQFNIGAAFSNAPIEQAQALQWYQKAADQGYAKAQNALGLTYAKGEGIHKDYKQAVEWYRKAADQGYAKAQMNLGLAYANRQGAPLDYSEAYFWTDLATKGGEDAKGVRDMIASRLSSATLTQVQEREQKWLDDHSSKAKPQ